MNAAASGNSKGVKIGKFRKSVVKYICKEKEKATSHGYSEKAQAATDLTAGSNLVYCATYTYTYK